MMLRYDVMRCDGCDRRDGWRASVRVARCAEKLLPGLFLDLGVFPSLLEPLR